MPAIKDLSGQRFGRLVVIDDSGQRRRRNVVWRCLCDCGVMSLVSGHNLRSWNTRSCGCLMREVCSDIGKAEKHGHAGGNRFTPTYRSWVSMKDRCSRTNAGNYDWYGGRGIRVCDRWQSFENFLADMGERPPNKTLDRIDNNGNYEPGNCRWATAKEQAANRRYIWANRLRKRRAA